MTHSLARVAALLPVFNDERYPPGWFEAVGQQVGACVVLDDGSTDGSVELLASHPAVYRLMRVDPHLKAGTDVKEAAQAQSTFDALILDMDGVIVHTPSLHRRVWADFVERAPWPEVRAQRSRSSARRAQDVLTELLSHRLSTEEIDRVVEELHSDFLSLRGSLDTVFPAVREFIGSRATPLAVATSAPRHVAESLLGDLIERFDVVVTSEDCTAGKPDPEAYRRAREALGVAPGRALVVEDTAIGVSAAIAAGCVVWAIVHDDTAAAACYSAGASLLCRSATAAAALMRSEFVDARIHRQPS